jgi:hypothetical protein
MQLVVAPLDRDHRFRTLKDPEVFTAVLRTVPTFAAWLRVMDPISPIFPMAGLHNTLRRLVVDGAPVATGLTALGDSVCTTNPTLGRGLSLALWGAVDLVDALEKHTDWTTLALALDDRVGEHVVPFFEDQVNIDCARLSMLRHTIFGAPAPDPPPVLPDRVRFAELRIAAQVDPNAFRALWTIMGMLRRPDEVYTDPCVVAATRRVLHDHRNGAMTAQPTRD